MPPIPTIDITTKSLPKRSFVKLLESDGEKLFQ